MTARRVPIFSTIVVLAAVATMIALGVWQLGRKAEKEALIAQYQAALQSSDVITPFPSIPQGFLFRATVYPCRKVIGWEAISGRSANGQSGYAHVAQCEGPYAMPRQGGVGEVVVGWSRSPDSPTWAGGEVAGLIAAGGKYGWRVIANQPLAGLQPMAKPDPADLPNNHLAYAGQWFFFALTALVIYVLALRRRRR
ncbi:MAG: SURF1 family cytochrome oxidase biogenesis protein [Erythrobacter sp.]|nr:SURF1 family cytochrome oxidase biogenesis protein [Erythrobacter sp.]